MLPIFKYIFTLYVSYKSLMAPFVKATSYQWLASILVELITSEFYPVAELPVYSVRSIRARAKKGPRGPGADQQI